MMSAVPAAMGNSGTIDYSALADLARQTTATAAAAPPYTPLVLPAERQRIQDYFNQIGPIQGQIPGDRARAFLARSQLPQADLERIW